MTARFSFLLFLLVSFSAQAQIYKWVESDGKKNYSDKPPPTSVGGIEVKSTSTSEKNVELPYELAHAVKNMPVTLYSADNVSQSLAAKNFLMKNGIPFSEKTILTNEDIDQLKQITGSTQVPVLFIGHNKLSGFNASEWRTTLTQAGYPESNVLPANYHFPVSQPLAPTVTATIDTPANVKPNKSEPPARDPNGFHF